MLQLDNCTLVDMDFLDVVCSSCSKLTHLSLSSCQNIESDDFRCLKALKNLENLNLYRTLIGQNSLVEIIKSCNQLKCLNVGSCVKIEDFDQIMEILSEHGTQIQCLDLWRAYSLTQYGIFKLARNCRNIQELDIGWGYLI